MKHLIESLKTVFPSLETTCYLYSGQKDGETVYIIQSDSRWSDVGVHNYLFDRKGLFVHSFKGSVPQKWIDTKIRITKKNRVEIADSLKLVKVPVEVVYEDGNVIQTSINGTWTEIREYFRIGKLVNIGNGPLDNIQRITDLKLSF